MTLAGRLAPLSRLPRDARDTLFLLAVIACCIAPLAAHLPAWASAMTATLLAWRGWLAVGGRPLPGRWLTALLLALVVLLTLLSHGTIVGRDAGVTLIVMLLALKTLELRARRDAMVVFFLGFFTLLANFFYSQALPIAALMLVALLGLLTALVNAHMPVGRPPFLQAMRTAAHMMLLGAPLMALLFVLFPRMAPLWGLPVDKTSARTGLSAQMSIGSMASLVQDGSVALRVRFDGGEPPAPQELYFRGPVLTAFNGRDWFALSQPEARAITTAQPSAANLRVQGPPLRYEITLEPQRQPWLLGLGSLLLTALLETDELHDALHGGSDNAADTRVDVVASAETVDMAWAATINDYAARLSQDAREQPEKFRADVFSLLRRFRLISPHPLGLAVAAFANRFRAQPMIIDGPELDEQAVLF